MPIEFIKAGCNKDIEVIKSMCNNIAYGKLRYGQWTGRNKYTSLFTKMAI